MTPSEDAGTRAALLAFGRLVKRLRLAADLTQEELAERARVSPRLISDLERGTTHRPRRDTVELLADGLRVRGVDRERFIALARGRVSGVNPAADGGDAARHLLPRSPTPIVGRVKDIAAAMALLLSGEVRLLTLTGPGGVGKTRLALEIAHRIVAIDGTDASFVELAPVGADGHLIAVIAGALGVSADPSRPLRESVIATLRDRPSLLVLDNCEHLGTVGPLVAELLAACPDLAVLATSRKPLHLRAEHEYPVRPLGLPDLAAESTVAELGENPAVALLVRRALTTNRQFALTEANAATVAAIVARLDGLPLAIELAAPRLKVLSPAALLNRLESRLPLLTGGAGDLPARHQTLRRTLDWSYDLLSETEQVLFRRLSVFSGGCMLEAIEVVAAWLDSSAVAPAGSGGEVTELTELTELLGSHPRADRARSVLPPLDTRLPSRSPSSPSLPEPVPRMTSPERGDALSVLDLVSSLVDKSLLVTRDDGDERRFGMLETIREYGLERLKEAGEEEPLRRRHLAWALALAVRAEPELTGPEQATWLARLRAEHDNLRGALGWSVGAGDAESAMQLGGALYRFWATQGHFEEGSRWLDQALALETEARTAARGHALLGAGVMAYFRGEYDWAQAVWDEALSIFQEIGDSRGIAYCYGNLGLAADGQGDFARAASSYEAALTLFRQLDDQMYIGFMLHNLGLIAYFQSDSPRATALFTEALAVARERDDRNSVALALGNLALVALTEADPDRASIHQLEALRIGQEIGNGPWLARSVGQAGFIAAACRDGRRAARLLGAADAARSRFGAATAPHDRDFAARYEALARADIGDDAFRAAWQEGAAWPLDEAVAYVLGAPSASSQESSVCSRQPNVVS